VDISTLVRGRPEDGRASPGVLSDQPVEERFDDRFRPRMDLQLVLDLDASDVDVDGVDRDAELRGRRLVVVALDKQLQEPRLVRRPIQ
jgi:hypothetical protein